MALRPAFADAKATVAGRPRIEAVAPVKITVPRPPGSSRGLALIARLDPALRGGAPVLWAGRAPGKFGPAHHMLKRPADVTSVVRRDAEFGMVG